MSVRFPHGKNAPGAWAQSFELSRAINRLWATTMVGARAAADWRAYRRARAALWRSHGFDWRSVNRMPRVFGRRRAP
jgi:hypothetical protein